MSVKMLQNIRSTTKIIFLCDSNEWLETEKLKLYNSSPKRQTTRYKANKNIDEIWELKLQKAFEKNLMTSEINGEIC